PWSSSGTRCQPGFAARARLREPGLVGQVAAVGLMDPGVAAHAFDQHRGADAPARHHVLPDLAEAEAAVEDARRVAVVLDEDLAGQDRVAELGIALHVGVDGAAHAATAPPAGDDHPVDVHEIRIALGEPAEIA